MPTYSFLDVRATIVGPGGTFPLGAGAGNAEEGISIEFTEDKDRLVTGADGSPMHSLNASKAGRILVRLLKTSPVNALLAQLYSFQQASSLNWGQNVFVLTNLVTGDDYSCTSVAFEKFPRNDFAKEAGILEWGFLAGSIDPVLGSGILTDAV
jgi:Protein of unknown function (DUF3277)